MYISDMAVGLCTARSDFQWVRWATRDITHLLVYHFKVELIHLGENLLYLKKISFFAQLFNYGMML